MMDLIDREQAIEKIKAVTRECIPNLPEGPCKRCFIWGTNTVIQTILHDVPSAEKTGKWENDGHTLACSNCHTINIRGVAWNYCPNCGARMVSDEH